MSCSELPIYNFFKVVEDKDLSLLIKKKSKIEDFEEDELFNALTSIFKEYNELTDNRPLIKEFRSKLDIDFMEFRYHITKEILSLYVESESIDVLITLRELQWSIDTSKEINPQIERITKRLIGIKNQINISKARFVEQFQKKQKQDNPNFNLQKEILNLEINLPLSYKIDIHKDSIEKYVLWNKLLESKNKSLKQMNNG